jgi:hypothetical protein
VLGFVRRTFHPRANFRLSYIDVELLVTIYSIIIVAFMGAKLVPSS